MCEKWARSEICLSTNTYTSQSLSPILAKPQLKFRTFSPIRGPQATNTTSPNYKSTSNLLKLRILQKTRLRSEKDCCRVDLSISVSVVVVVVVDDDDNQTDEVPCLVLKVCNCFFFSSEDNNFIIHDFFFIFLFFLKAVIFRFHRVVNFTLIDVLCFSYVFQL